jgi:hypothetical protein
MSATRFLSIAVIATAACATSPTTAGPVPTRADVAAALEHVLNTRCDGDIESDGCVSHPSAVSVTELRCSPEGGGIARCRYSMRVRSVSYASRWQDEAARFRFDSGRQIWSLIGEF